MDTESRGFLDTESRGFLDWESHYFLGRSLAVEFAGFLSTFTSWRAGAFQVLHHCGWLSVPHALDVVDVDLTGGLFQAYDRQREREEQLCVVDGVELGDGVLGDVGCQAPVFKPHSHIHASATHRHVPIVVDGGFRW